jgi:hypothetical protein
MAITGPKKGIQRGERIFSGGTFSDVLDVLQIPQFAITGALDPKTTVKQAIQTRKAPSEALGLGPVSGLAADVVLDPLNIFGVGALTKAGRGIKGVKALKKGAEALDVAEQAGKIGRRAATLAEQAARGERALLTAFGKPLIKGEGVFQALTKTGEAIKGTRTGSQLAKFFNISPATGGKTFKEIEQLAQVAREVKEAGLRSKAKQLARLSEGMGLAKVIDSEFDKLVKRGLAKTADKPTITSKVIENIAKIDLGAKVPKSLDNIVAAITRGTEDILNVRKTTGAPELLQKVFPNVPAKASKEFLETKKPAFSRARQFASADPSSLRAKYFRLGDAIVEADKGIAREVGEGGREFLQVGDMYFEKPSKLSEGARAIVQKAKDIRTQDPNQMLNQIRSIVASEGLTLSKGVQKELSQIFTKPAVRRAVQPGELNQALEMAGKGLRFSEDPSELVPTLFARTGKSEAKQNFVREVSSMGIEKPAVIPDGWSESSLPELKGLIFPETITNHIDSTHKAFSNIEEVNDFVKGYDKLLNFWKGTATFVNPAFHARNSVSNLWQGYLGGVNMGKYLKAGGIQRKLSGAGKLKNGKVVQAADLLTPEELKIWEGFVNEGLGGTGWFGADIEKNLDDFRKKKGIRGVFDKPFEAGGTVGSFVEDNAKLGMFADRLAKGYSTAEAAADVRKFFFDYQDLSPFEKNVMKRVFPFYTWTRKNLPLQVAMLIQEPTKFTQIAKMKTAIEKHFEDQRPLDPKLVPGWMREGYPIFFGRNENNLARYFRLQGFLPSVDLESIGKPTETAIGLVSPFIKAPFELAGNRNLFMDREIEEFPGQTVEVAGFNIPADTAYFIRNIRPIMELDRMMDEKLTIQERLGKFVLGAKFQNLDEQKQKRVFQYLQGLQQSKIKRQIERERKEGNVSAIPNLQELLRETRTDFRID